MLWAFQVVQCLGIYWQREGHQFNPWSGRIPHAVEQLSLCTTTMEPLSDDYWALVLQRLVPVHLTPVLCNKRRHRKDKPEYPNEEKPLFATTRKSPHVAVKPRCSSKVKSFLKKDLFQDHMTSKNKIKDYKVS